MKHVNLLLNELKVWSTNHPGIQAPGKFDALIALLYPCGLMHDAPCDGTGWRHRMTCRLCQYESKLASRAREEPVFVEKLPASSPKVKRASKSELINMACDVVFTLKKTRATTWEVILKAEELLHHLEKSEELDLRPLYNWFSTYEHQQMPTVPACLDILNQMRSDQFQWQNYIKHMGPTRPSLPTRDTNLSGEEQGLFNKFTVVRNDGSSSHGKKHDGCEYFVLDVDHDPYSKAAVLAYAEACKETHPLLSADLIKRYGPVNKN